MNFNISPPWVSIAVVVRRERRSIGGNLEAIGRFAINAGQRAPCETGHIPDFYVHGTPTSFSAPLTEAPPAAQQRRDNRREAPTSSRFVRTDPSAGPSPISLLERRWPNAHESPLTPPSRHARCSYILAPALTLTQIAGEVRSALDRDAAQGSVHGIAGPEIINRSSATPVGCNRAPEFGFLHPRRESPTERNKSGKPATHSAVFGD